MTSLQQVKWITVGGIGELDDVPEGAAYTEKNWGDQTEIGNWVKKGNFLGLTLEAIDRDDTRRLQQTPRALAQALHGTLSQTDFAVAGLGQPGGLPDWIADLRAQKPTDDIIQIEPYAVDSVFVAVF